MEQQEEEKKIKKVYKRQRRRRSKSSSSLPLDLASDILLRLPEKSVVRFRCVSKSWSSITTDPYFINLFKTRSPRFLVCFTEMGKLFVSSIPQHHQTFETNCIKTYSSSQPIDRYDMEFPTHGIYRPTESVEGLICFLDVATPIVWNPSTKRYLTLPKVPNMMKNDFKNYFLGYDPVESKHKVICILGNSIECKVLTLGSSWRSVKTNFKHCSGCYTCGRCIKGVVYFLSRVFPMDVWVLRSFDVRSEKFDKIELPPSDIRNDVQAYQGRLAFVDRKPNRKNGIRLWIFVEEHKWWSSKDFLAPFDHPRGITNLFCYFKLIGFTHTGEFIYVVLKLSKVAYILFCDPVRNSFRRFELRGITDDDKSVLSKLVCAVDEALLFSQDMWLDPEHWRQLFDNAHLFFTRRVYR